MDFFTQQDLARRQTNVLLLHFSLAVAGTVLLTYFLPLGVWILYSNYTATVPLQLDWWHPELFIGVCAATLLVIAGGSLYKIAELRRGGGAGLAEMLGGNRIAPGSDDFFEKRLHHIVEEMAIASGTPVPTVYVLKSEPGINAFAAGFGISDAVIAVTYGAMTGLTRDELQGVIAHEFSHILNRDMRMNLNLMGIVHGLLVIGLAGRGLLEVARYTGRSSRNSRGSPVPLIATGLVLWIIGLTGMFFAKLIKAAISRSRERLADASAVQFTRNPAGLASALKKIGGLTQGSLLLNPNAPQASHLFFGQGIRGSLLSTHPPLVERVRWLEPTFDGSFPPIRYDSLREHLTHREQAPTQTEEKPCPNVVDLFTAPHSVAVAAPLSTAPASSPPPTFRRNNPEALIDAIGQSHEHHTQAARALIDAIPEGVKTRARDPHGARLLVYLLLLDSDPALRDQQIALIHSRETPDLVNTLAQDETEIGPLRPELRLPIIDLAIPALRFLSPEQYASFRRNIRDLVTIDGQTDVFEYALQHVLLSHLAPLFSGSAKPRPTNYYAIRGLAQETSVVLSTLARKGHENEEQADRAFRNAVNKIPEPKAEFHFLSAADCCWENVDAALERFNEASFKVKKWLLGAALACLIEDGEISIEEAELFRAIADALACPVPPWVVPNAS